MNDLVEIDTGYRSERTFSTRGLDHVEYQPTNYEVIEKYKKNGNFVHAGEVICLLKIEQTSLAESSPKRLIAQHSGKLVKFDTKRKKVLCEDTPIGYIDTSCSVSEPEYLQEEIASRFDDIEEFYRDKLNTLSAAFLDGTTETVETIKGKEFHYQGFWQFAQRPLMDFSKKEKTIMMLVEMLHESGEMDYFNYSLNKYRFAAKGEKGAYTPMNEMIGGNVQRLLKYADMHPDTELANRINKHARSSSSKWLEKQDVYRSKFLSTKSENHSILLGRFPNERTHLYYNGARGLITLAAPNSGKTAAGILTNLAFYKGSAIVLDIKGECYDKTASIRKQRYGRVLKFAPASPEDSACYNPLDFLPKEKKKVWAGASDFANLLNPISDLPAKDAVWENTGQAMLTLAVAYSVMTEERPHMGHVRRNLSVKFSSMLTEIITKEDAGIFPENMIIEAYRFEEFDDSDKLSSFRMSAEKNLGNWTDDGLMDVIKTSDWTPQSLREEGTTLYISIPQNSVETWQHVIRVIVGQHINMLMAAGEEEAFKKSGNAPILFFLDEFPAIGKMLPIITAMDKGRSCGLKVWIVAQALGQLEMIYSKLASVIKNMCGVELYLTPDFDQAKYISERMGRRKALFDEDQNLNVVEPQDIQAGEEYEDKVIAMFGQGHNAVLDKVYAFSEDGNFNPSGGQSPKSQHKSKPKRRGEQAA